MGDVWGHANVQGSIQMYGGMYRSVSSIQCMADVQMWGSYTPLKHTDSQTCPHICQLHLGTIFLIKFYSLNKLLQHQQCVLSFIRAMYSL